MEAFGGFRVAIVDDDVSIREALSGFLRAAGVVCESYSSALAFTRQADPARYVCILADFNMPGMDGLALHRWLVEGGWGVPVILMSAQADAALREAAFRQGIHDVLDKPPDLARIHTLLKALSSGEPKA